RRTGLRHRRLSRNVLGSRHANRKLRVRNAFVWLNDPGMRNGNEKTPSGCSVCGLLVQDLTGKVPCEQQHQIRLTLKHVVGMDDRDMLPGRQPAVLERVSVGHELEKAGIEVEAVHEGRSLGCGTIGGDAPAASLLGAQQSCQRCAELGNTFGKALVPADAVNSKLALIVQQRNERRAPLDTPADPEAQRDAMDGKTLDVIYVQAMPGEERNESVQGVIEVMLVVDGVEFAFLD